MKHHFAVNLRLARKRSGLSQADCAHLLGIEQPRMSKLEAGIYEPTVKEACTLSILYEMPITELYSETTDGVVRLLEEQLASMPNHNSIWRGRKRRLDTLASLGYRLHELKSKHHDW